MDTAMPGASTTPKVLKYLHQNPDRELFVDNIAVELGMNREQVQSSLRRIRNGNFDRGKLDVVERGNCVYFDTAQHSNGHRPAVESVLVTPPRPAIEGVLVTPPPPAPPKPAFPIGLTLEVMYTAGDTHIAMADNGKHYRITLEPL